MVVSSDQKCEIHFFRIHSIQKYNFTRDFESLAPLRITTELKSSTELKINAKRCAIRTSLFHEF